jgi:hypothetical protein
MNECNEPSHTLAVAAMNCDLQQPAKRELQAGLLSEFGLCILRHSSGSEQLKKWGS